MFRACFFRNSFKHQHKLDYLFMSWFHSMTLLTTPGQSLHNFGPQQKLPLSLSQEDTLYEHTLISSCRTGYH